MKRLLRGFGARFVFLRAAPFHNANVQKAQGRPNASGIPSTSFGYVLSNFCIIRFTSKSTFQTTNLRAFQEIASAIRQERGQGSDERCHAVLFVARGRKKVINKK